MSSFHFPSHASSVLLLYWDYLHPKIFLLSIDLPLPACCFFALLDYTFHNSQKVFLTHIECINFWKSGISGGGCIAPYGKTRSSGILVIIDQCLAELRSSQKFINDAVLWDLLGNNSFSRIGELVTEIILLSSPSPPSPRAEEDFSCESWSNPIIFVTKSAGCFLRNF